MSLSINRRKSWKTLLTCAGVAAGLAAPLTTQAPLTAAADTKATSSAAVEASYDLSVPGSILAYHNEISQGGLDLSTNQMSTQSANADVAFDDQAGTIGARNLVDLGAVSFDSVNSLPDSGFQNETSATVGHVYIVQTHDNRYAKVLIEAVGGGKVSLRIAFMQPSTSGGQTDGSSTGGKSGTGSGTHTQTGTGTTTTGNTITYNTSLTNTILSISNPLSGGGISLTTKKMTTSAASADLVFGDNGGSIGARSVIDMGLTELAKVTDVPGNGSTVLKVVPKHVYIVKTHDDKYVKVYIQSVRPGQIVFQFGSVGGKGKTELPSGTGNIVKITNLPPTIPPVKIDIRIFLNHKWKLVVPSTTYTTTNDAENTQTTVSSVGAPAGDLYLSSNGTYVWNDPIDGRVKGKWEHVASDWPILLLGGPGHEDWKLGKSTAKLGGSIIVWDGNVWEIGLK